MFCAQYILKLPGFYYLSLPSCYFFLEFKDYLINPAACAFFKTAAIPFLLIVLP
jgi:hypothetical protein